MQRYYKIISSGNICLYHFYGKYYLHQRRPCTIRAAIRQCCAVVKCLIKQKRLYLTPDTTPHNSNLTAKNYRMMKFLFLFYYVFLTVHDVYALRQILERCAVSHLLAVDVIYTLMSIVARQFGNDAVDIGRSAFTVNHEL